MNVLSLFDGISCGRVALERVGIKVDKYYASEIDKNAIKITMKNYPDTIQMGDVTKVKAEDLPKIDLLIGGSPCQGFSFAGKQLNFKDERSKLFFEYVRLLKECKPKYFLLENVEMRKEYRDVISLYLGVEPIMINSNLVSAQDRKRLYWTNIPNITHPNDKKIYLRDIVERERSDWRKVGNWVYQTWGGFGDIKLNRLRKINADKSFTLTTNKTHPQNYYLNEEKTMYTNLNSIEFERLQTLPDNYTSGICEGDRCKALGNGWTVDVIAHIFKGIR